MSPAGNDASDGSAAHPWRTISHAAAVAESGDTVTIHAGVYREWVKPANAGREGAPITYRAAKGERVVVTGADEVRGWTKRPDGLWEAHVSYDSFGGVNPFTDFIEGSWFLPKDLNHFRTRLIQCGKQYVVIIVNLRYGNNQQTMILADVTVNQCSRTVSALPICN